MGELTYVTGTLWPHSDRDGDKPPWARSLDLRVGFTSIPHNIKLWNDPVQLLLTSVEMVGAVVYTLSLVFGEPPLGMALDETYATSRTAHWKAGGVLEVHLPYHKVLGPILDTGEGLPWGKWQGSFRPCPDPVSGGILSVDKVKRVK